MAALVLALHQSLDEGVPLQQSSLLAYHYAQAALLSGHQILQVFFYQDAVQLARCDLHDPLLKTTQQLWQQLAQQHDFDLVYCATIAEREFGLQREDIAVGFIGAGVTEFAQAAARANRVLQF
ncbi:sulfurtransferase TusD [Pseudidiomarina aestuarii]|uniref:Sulfurtransferase TusD n=1 Tax=Pseudidiomarina aestuarii TaxID=624146 RepID=A0A7Z7ETF0_9GAMM|nr:DsrE family protein [Pseudidiomarina aestuarii]RUO41048.1 sulfurtransferase TusD [Pseudidiomarina aestuarii]